MSLKILSFLGATEYLPCIYNFKDKEDKPTKYFQTAIGEYFFRDRLEDTKDKLIIFCTDKALAYFNCRKEDRIHEFEDDMWKGKKLQQELDESEILRNRYAVKKVECEVNDVWGLFECIFEEINEDDEIVFDLTNSFRILPLIAMVVLNFAKYVKNIKIKGIYYGAFEAVGNFKQVSELPLKRRIIPVYNMSDFNLLIDWIVGTEKYLSSGNAEMLKELIIDTKDLENSKVIKDIEKKEIKLWIKKIEEFSEAVGVSNVIKIDKLGNEIKESFPMAKSVVKNILPPLDKVMNKIEGNFEKYSPTETVKNIHETVKWCCEHNMIQQAYTLFRENIVTYIYERLNIEGRFKNNFNKYKYEKSRNYYRNLISCALNNGYIILEKRRKKKNLNNLYNNYNYRKKPFDGMDIKKDDYEGNKKVIFDMLWNSKIDTEIYDIFYCIKNPRNEINHAGYVIYDELKNVDKKNLLNKAIKDFSRIIGLK